MFSRTLFRSSVLRSLPRAPIPRITFLNSTLHLPRRQPPPSILQHFRAQHNYPQGPRGSRPTPRIVHYRYDPETARNARPLLTGEQVSRTLRSPSFRWIIIISGGSAVIFYFGNLEEVPVSGRRRFNCYSDATVERDGELMYRKIMAEAQHALLPSWDARSQMVERVMDRLIPASGLQDVNWEVHVIHSDEKNAFVIPGGKVFVFSGIIPIAQTDDGLAAILGHEIAHNVARHAAESMSSMVMIAPIRWALVFLDVTGFTFGFGRILGDFALELGIARPASRKQESEADYIGLMMMAKSCYDPHAAVGVWQRMEAAEMHGMPEWLSTHPSNANRIEMMQAWLPKAEEMRSDSGCSVTMGYVKDFQAALGGGWGTFAR